MKNNLKKFFDVFTDLLLWFVLGVATIKALDLANFLMTYPNDIAFFAGLLIYIICIGAIGYAIYSIITHNQNKNKNEN